MDSWAVASLCAQEPLELSSLNMQSFPKEGEVGRDMPGIMAPAPCTIPGKISSGLSQGFQRY